MSDFYIGEIRPFAFDFPPRFWAHCDGQILSIAQNLGLFDLLGATYGGDGQTTFALPNLQGRAPVGYGQGPGLSNYGLGAQGGATTVTLSVANLPSHGHPPQASSAAGDRRDPFPLPSGAGYRWAGSSHPQYSTGSPDVTMAAQIASAGGDQPHSNESPYIVVNYCIAVNGLTPSRN